jgi:hypothetical protein
MPIDVTTKTSNILRDVHVCRTVLLTHFAEETRKDGRNVFHNLILESEQYVAKQTPGEKVKPYRTNGGADPAVHTG